MKNTLLTLTLSTIMIAAIFSNCQSPAVKETKNNLSKTQNDLIKVQQDSITAYQKFIKESEDKINAYEKNIAEIKAQIANKTKEEKTKYERKLVQLEQKNKALKAKIINYKDKQIDDWDQIQVEFRKDLNELGSAIADFFVKGV